MKLQKKARTIIEFTEDDLKEIQEFRSKNPVSHRAIYMAGIKALKFAKKG